MTEQLLSENRDGVLVVSFNRPEKKNAINNAMWVAIRDTFRSAAADDSVACVLLRGEGDNFCAGVDLASFGEGEGDPVPNAGIRTGHDRFFVREAEVGKFHQSINPPPLMSMDAPLM